MLENVCPCVRAADVLNVVAPVNDALSAYWKPYAVIVAQPVFPVNPFKVTSRLLLFITGIFPSNAFATVGTLVLV